MVNHADEASRGAAVSHMVMWCRLQVRDLNIPDYPELPCTFPVHYPPANNSVGKTKGTVDTVEDKIRAAEQCNTNKKAPSLLRDLPERFNVKAHPDSQAAAARVKALSRKRTRVSFLWREIALLCVIVHKST